ncbi:hypothetical protein H8A99_28135, partial [Bradyrhizobium sp. Arg68]|uniref:hypothetical protein n=1 Tax=Bradyrhizobium ivorense TaxID=2511166 RepID=UPI001E373ACE
MFDSPFDFLTLVIAIIAIALAQKAMSQVSALRRRLDAIEGAGAARTAMPPPLVPMPDFEQAPPMAPSASQPPPLPEPPPILPEA